MKQSLPEIIRKIVADETGEGSITTATLFSDLSLDRLDEIEIIINIEEQIDIDTHYYDCEELSDFGYNCHTVAEKLFSLFPELQDKYNMSEIQDKVDNVIDTMKKHREKPYLKNYWLKGTTELPKQGQKLKLNQLRKNDGIYIGQHPFNNEYHVIGFNDSMNTVSTTIATMHPFTEAEVDALEAKPLTDKIELLMSQTDMACEFEDLPANVQNSLEVIAEFLMEVK